MAFGFGFNKQKVLSSAEKFVQQGKLQNAIAEYEKILKADPKDLTVMNTVGDLYARIGNTDKAVECFKSVGDAYASQGFTVKAIAMYKKLTKLKSSLESVLRLAELYTQQGLFNDARAQYLQVAEEFLKDNQLEQAVRIFQKTLEMDPENVAMRTRLAEVYLQLGKNQEAWQIFSAVVENLRGKGQLSAADEILRRMLKLDPGNSQALLLRGKNAYESGDIAGAAQQLEKVADLDNHPEGLHTLLQSYLQLGDLAQAEKLAEKLLSVHNDANAFLGYLDALIAEGQFEQVLRLCQQHSDKFLSGNSEKVLEKLHMMIGHVRENTAALEMLLELLNKVGETTHLTEIYELLAHAYVQSGDLQKAQGYYLKLTQLEPENQIHATNYQQVLEKLGPLAGATRGITAQEGAAIVDELEATAPYIEQRYDNEVEIAVRAALTDAELFVSYNMAPKALGPLLLALPRAPRDLRINQRLASLFTRAGQFADAAGCCRTLQSIYHDAGYPEEADRYRQLATKYEENVASGAVPSQATASLAAVRSVPVPPPPVKAVEKPAPAEFAVTSEVSEMAIDPGVPEMPVTPPSVAAPAESSGSGLFFHAPKAAPPEEPVATETPVAAVVAAPADQPAVDPSAKEIDLSAEWDGEISDDATLAEASPQTEPETAKAHAAEAAQAQAEIIQEIRFYLDQHMPEEARAALGKLEQLKPESYVLDGLRDAIDSAAAQPPTAQAGAPDAEEPQPPAWEEPATEEPAPAEVAETAPAAETLPTFDVSVPEMAVVEAASAEPVPEAQPSAAPEPDPEAAEVASAATEPAARTKSSLDDFVTDLEASLGDGFMAEAPAAVQPPASVAPSPAAPWPQSTPAPEPAPQQMPPMPLPIPPQPSVAISASTGSTAAATAPALEQQTGAPAFEQPLAAPSSQFSYEPSKQRELGEPEAPADKTAARIDLMGMFGELKTELEEDQAAGDDDPETHYNLGVGFREMGLMEEAIGEFQKVCQSVESGNPFNQMMQTYTWLAQCFIDKGMPEAAVHWYEKALKLPGIGTEAQTALHYELASAHETAGNKPAALDHFTAVYANNIDYRGVAERIQALKS
ncbi:MAG TPA: tetratricopeptide repeat protein [Terriglobales bacterium]